MIEQIPLLFKLDNGVMGRPADDRGKNRSLKSERAERILADAVDQLVRSACRIR
ncbi:hypothetical protein D3C79_1008040 [compost metagenome]